MKVRELTEYCGIFTPITLAHISEPIGTYRNAEEIPKEYRERDVWRIGTDGMKKDALMIIIS